MSKLKSLKIEIPMVESTIENRLHGGFLAIGNSGISVHGGPNSFCGNNSVCSDNNKCYDNNNSQACAGNPGTCVSNTSVSTVTPTSTKTSTSSTSFTFDVII